MRVGWTTKATVGLIVLAAILGAGGCRKPAKPQESGLAVVSSTFPVWLLTRNVTVGVPNVSVSLLLPATLGCPHDYSVTPSDIQRLEKADILVVNGMGLDDFAVEQFGDLRPSGKVIVASQPISDADQHGTEDGHGHSHDHTATEAEGHQFASPKLAAEMVRRIGDGLAEADPGNADRYIRNAKAYARRLNDLANEFRAAVATMTNKRVIVQHSVFDFLARDVGLEIVGVIQAHAGHDPSAQEVMELVRKAKAMRAAAVITEPQYPPRLGRTIAGEAGIRSGVLDPVASGPDTAPLDHYETAMRTNIRTLPSILGATASGG